MESREKIRALLDSMDDGQRKMLAEELGRPAERPAFAIEDITVDRLRDREFSSALRAEVVEALKGLR